MKVLLVNTYDQGGAAKACIRLHKGLLRNGVESSLLFLHRSASEIIEHSYLYSPGEESLLNKIKKKIKLSPKREYHQKMKKQIRSLIPGKIEWFSFPDSGIDITDHPAYRHADIINLHWVADFLDYSFFKKNNKPVVWTMHDMNPFTGGCHYSGECKKYLNNCAHCPLLIECDDDSYSGYVYKKKQKYLASATGLSIIAPSQWLMNVSKNSPLSGKFPHQCIPYGMDPSVFVCYEKNDARKQMNLPLDKKIVLFVAHSLHTKRKGYFILREAIDMFKDENILLCSVGVKGMQETNDRQVIEMGHISDENQMSLVYSAADVFVIPSIEDNLPNTVIESLLCGTPVIGFRIGGIPDMIQNGQNGYLADKINAQSLYEAVNSYLSDINLFDRKKIRQNALLKYDLNVQANSYMELYKNCIYHQQN